MDEYLNAIPASQFDIWVSGKKSELKIDFGFIIRRWLWTRSLKENVKVRVESMK